MGSIGRLLYMLTRETLMLAYLAIAHATHEYKEDNDDVAGAAKVLESFL